MKVCKPKKTIIKWVTNEMKVIVVTDDDGHIGVLLIKRGLHEITNADVSISVRGREKLIEMMEIDRTGMLQ